MAELSGIIQGAECDSAGCSGDAPRCSVRSSRVLGPIRQGALSNEQRATSYGVYPSAVRPTPSGPWASTVLMSGQVMAIAVPTAAGRDDTARLGGLFDAHHDRLYRLARRLSQSADDARDLVQDTFLRAARSPGSVPDGM